MVFLKNYLRTNNFFSVFSNTQIATDSRKKVKYEEKVINDNRRKNVNNFSVCVHNFTFYFF